MPPIHPAVVHYPIALVTLSVIADLLGYFTNSPTLQATGTWALFGAGIGAAVAIVAGLIDMKRAKIKPAPHKRVHFHMKIGFTLFAAIVLLTVWRWVVTLDPHHGLGWSYLIPAFVVLALTLFQGWLGGELVFTDGVGVAPTGQGMESATAAKKEVAQIADDESEHHEH
ncbi:MAG TPA: DUF2231 domain-containing protein [Pyrinomonadaceae bacterium]|nr:DUF2231 domain-containing protein [Pyrinomonadaceae bacterium]